MLNLEQNEVAVWWARPEFRPSWLAEMDDGERARAAEFHREADRARFASGVVVLRRVLGTHLGIPPSAVPISRTCPDCLRPHGRPTLGPGAGAALGLSVSHSGSWAAVAISRMPGIGLDVERIQSYSDLLDNARFALCDGEYDHLVNAPAPADAFTAAWVRKEAVLKCTGIGLRTAPADICITATPHPRVATWAGHPGLAERISVCDLSVDRQHRAAIAVLDGVATTITQRKFDWADAPADVGERSPVADRAS